MKNTQADTRQDKVCVSKITTTDCESYNKNRNETFC